MLQSTDKKNYATGNIKENFTNKQYLSYALKEGQELFTQNRGQREKGHEDMKEYYIFREGNVGMLLKHDVSRRGNFSENLQLQS